MTKAFALDTMKLQELKNLLENARRLGREDVVVDILRELTKRGAARSADFVSLTWNQKSASEALDPFVDVSRTVPRNERTTYTEAGGRKIGRAKDDPARMWVDTYTAIKTATENAVLVCYIPQPGDEAFFELHLSGEVAARYSPDELGDALARWKAIAAACA